MVSKPGFIGQSLRRDTGDVDGHRIKDDEAHATERIALPSGDYPDFAERSGRLIPSTSIQIFSAILLGSRIDLGACRQGSVCRQCFHITSAATLKFRDL